MIELRAPTRSSLPHRLVVLALGGVLCLAGCGGGGGSGGGGPYPLDDALRLNDLQAKGTHNSYRYLDAPPLLPDWDYSHAPLATQLESQGVRQLELDLHWDADEGLYRVYHLDMVDMLSRCDRFVDCLKDVRGWSEAHRLHQPIFIMLEPKGGFDLDVLDARHAELDAEIRSVFSEDELITPDMVRGTHASVREAIQTEGWPTLGQTRGRVLFFYNCSRPVCVAYANHGEGLAGRVVFADANADDPWAGVRVMNTPGPDVKAAVEAGFIVRTWPEDLTKIIAGEPSNLQAGLDSGAQLISTDFPVSREDIPFVTHGVDYVMNIPGGTPSRCDPITAPADCRSTDIENPDHLATP
ncbi:MAG: hypothetical protein KC543_02115 [Myxococcales bacterium]|nr:hypothetical protein [Myxococcales bacterium]